MITNKNIILIQTKSSSHLILRQSIKSGRFLCMSALKASPSRHEDVKSDTLTPGYLAVERLAQLRRASRAVTFGSWPTTMSDICKERETFSY